MNLEEKLAHAFSAHPWLGILWAAGIAISVGALLVLFSILRRRHQAGQLTTSAPPSLKLPASDVLGVFFVLTWLMVFPAASGLFFAATIGGVLWLLRFHRIDIRNQWGLGRFSLLKLAGLAVVIYLAAMGLITPVSYAVEALAKARHWNIDPQATVDVFLKTNDRLQLGWLVFAAVVLAPVTEEILFRGFLQPVFKSWLPAMAAWILTALIFALIHFHALSFPQLFLFGLVLGATYEITGSLPLCVGVHMCFNGATAVWLLLLKWWL